MSVPYVALLVMLLLALAVAAVVAIALAHRLSRRERTAFPSSALVAAGRHAGGIDALAWVGLVAALVVIQVSSPSLTSGLGTGVLIGLTPALAGATFLAVQAFGELTWPRPSGPVRRAPLTPRTVRTIAPVGLRRLTWVWAGGLALVLVACGMASGTGRDIERVWDASSSGAAGPFPGWFYGGPLLAATAIVVAATEIVLRLVARRPAVVDTTPADDLALRTLSSLRVLRGTQLVLAWTLAGVLLVAGSALRNVGTIEVDGAVRTSVGLVGGGTTLLALGLALALAGPVTILFTGVAASARGAAPVGRALPAASDPVGS
ncbi:MAG: hypothetical protein HHJ14_12320 [Cellulomonas sp.]|uniref:hypothetical protein n=1 Tax=Cellulomonas sp. TaxID=40001 RepID=UPI001827E871|nr:hypothetical protein [Cellulomonas sp.]NMM17866.1 hypothetical protein [Cellulomonas sp.]NMM32089.1 hypothetical protein [Cellulomonas sp.]